MVGADTGDHGGLEVSSIVTGWAGGEDAGGATGAGAGRAMEKKEHAAASPPAVSAPRWRPASQPKTPSAASARGASGTAASSASEISGTIAQSMRTRRRFSATSAAIAGQRARTCSGGRRRSA